MTRALLLLLLVAYFIAGPVVSPIGSALVFGVAAGMLYGVAAFNSAANRS